MIVRFWFFLSQVITIDNIEWTAAGSGGGGGTTTTEVLASYFETGWDNWTDGGGDCYRYNGSRSSEGSYSIRLRDNSGVASSMTSPSMDLDAYSEVTLDFAFRAYSMENGEDFFVKYSDDNGSTWTTTTVDFMWTVPSMFHAVRIALEMLQKKRLNIKNYVFVIF